MTRYEKWVLISATAMYLCAPLSILLTEVWPSIWTPVVIITGLIQLNGFIFFIFGWKPDRSGPRRRYDEFDRLLREARMGPYDVRLPSDLEEEYFGRNPL